MLTRVPMVEPDMEMFFNSDSISFPKNYIKNGIEVFEMVMSLARILFFPKAAKKCFWNETFDISKPFISMTLSSPLTKTKAGRRSYKSDRTVIF